MFEDAEKIVLANPELLQLLFSFLDTSGLAAASCTCRFWHQVAADKMWEKNSLLLYGTSKN